MNAALDQLDMFTGSPSKRPRAVHVRAHVRRIETAAARATDPQSSHDAADQHTASGNRQRHIEVVIDEVRAFQGLTSAEIAARTGLERHEAARRLPEAVTAGAVRKGAPRACTISGKRVTTWWSVA